MKGRVHIVGAGIGSPKFLTIAAKEALDAADVIIYDRLLHPEILSPYEDTKKELVYVGKKAADHTLTQDEINALMIARAKEGANVVRLKGGDPYVFGRGGEEAEYCLAHDVAFDVIPGVTSGVVSTMFAGIPVTHRDASTSVSFITGHRKKGYAGDFHEYARLSGTLVFYMGLNNLPLITKDLLEGGMDPKTPAAVIMHGGYPDQRVFSSTVGDIASAIEGKGFGSPSLIVIGEAVRYRESLNFYESLPLFGKKVLITRSKSQSPQLSAALAELGAEVIFAPTIAISYLNEEAMKEALEESYTHILFHSVHGVEAFFRAFFPEHDIRELAGTKLCVVGKKTAKLLQDRGLHPDLMPEVYEGDALARLIAEEEGEKRLLLPHSAKTPAALLSSYQEIGHLRDVVVYDAIRPEEKRDIPSEIDFALFTSSSTATHFHELYGLESLGSAKIVSIGRQTTKTLEELGHAPDLISKEATIESMIDAIKEFAHAHA